MESVPFPLHDRVGERLKFTPHRKGGMAKNHRVGWVGKRKPLAAVPSRAQPNMSINRYFLSSNICLFDNPDQGEVHGLVKGFNWVWTDLTCEQRTKPAMGFNFKISGQRKRML